MGILSKITKYLENKKFKRYEDMVEQINLLEGEISSLSDDELSSKTQEFKRRIENGETPDEIMYEAFAVAREAAKRTVGMRPFDVQLIGGIVLHEGKIAEMKTGEGKTLAATLPVYLNALFGKSVHLVTVNDYLAKRDAEWMGPIYNFLGLSVGYLQNMMPAEERKKAYQCDVIYGTNSEFGFDYLRDNMALDEDELVQRGHDYAILDEVDSILIDEARTPLIISGPSERSAKLYRKFAKIVPRLKEGTHYEVDFKTKTVTVTEEGITKVEKELNLENLYDPSNVQLLNHLNQALKAQVLFKKDKDYVVKDGEVVIVDEFTGRLMEGRRYSEGLHQAIEAKEMVKIKEENQTLANISLQNYFRMYEKLAGMTGTAATEAEEFKHIYGLEVVVIPTNEPMIRKDYNDLIYKSEDAKFKAVVEEIKEKYEKGQPVLVGTISIENNEKLSSKLTRAGIKHNVLNAKNHELEAQIIAQAGRMNSVTVATNMAGRGVDIVLGGNPPDSQEAEKVKELGGLHVLGTERHESRRIDNQLRGRSGRQGDPGSSRFYVSLEDELLKSFGYEKVQRLMERLGLPDNVPIEHSLVSKTIETAQKQMESYHFNIRKRLLEYDDVLNKQREAIYSMRRNILVNKKTKQKILEFIDEVAEMMVDNHISTSKDYEYWNLDGLETEFEAITGKKPDSDISSMKNYSLILEAIKDEMKDIYTQKEEEISIEMIREVERILLLQTIDYWWREHLYDMDYLREGISLRAYGQKDPLVEYKIEGFKLYEHTMQMVKEQTLKYLYHIEVTPQLLSVKQRRNRRTAESGTGSGKGTKAPLKSRKKVGRNDPCPCGSGKKYKKCCGRSY